MMREAELIATTRSPVTRDSLLDGLKGLGIRPGDTLMVHSSLRSLGWVNGGAVAVVDALLQSVGPAGTIVMPAHTADITDPANWRSPPIPAAWVETVRATMPVFNPRISPTRGMGKIAELFRSWPGASRSSHPSCSFAALGPLAEEITSRHDLDDPLGRRSPLGALYRLGAKVLLIGVDFDRCTALHLAEDLAFSDGPKIREGAPMLVDGMRRWVAFDVRETKDADEFVPIGAEAAKARLTSSGPLGEGRGIVADLRELVDFAVRRWAA
jgi:aminoglycoside 3-N-acetyltransferase